MKKIFRKSQNSARFAIFIFSIFIYFAHFQAALATTSVSGEILTDTVWTKAESPYVVEYYLEVGEGATLTIEPGVIIKFNQSYIDVYGKISALGTEQEKIYFTSFLDDSVGGDTNDDGAATEPDDGDWLGINLYQPSSGSQFDYADFKYAETNFYLYSSDLKLASSSLSFINYAAIDSIDSNLSVSSSKFEDYYYGIDATGGTLNLINNNFNKGEFPVYADYETDIKNSGNLAENNEYNGIGLYGNSYGINFNKVFYKDIPYVLFNDLSINSSSTAVFDPGVIIKSEGWSVGVNVYGKLTAMGKDDDKIILTSIFDDSVYGDTNPNGGDNLPGIGSWDGIYFGRLSSGSDLENFIIKYSDGIYFDSIDADLDKIYVEDSAGLDVYNGNLKISNSILKNNYEGVDVYKGNAEIADTIFQNNRSGIDVFEGNVKVDNSIITNSHNGIYIYSGDLKINDSVINNNKYGIIASKSSLDLRNSFILDNLDSGVDSWKAEEMNIIDNNIVDNKIYGIYLDSASTTISGNFIFGNGGSGIYVATSAPATIANNDIYNNADFGIYNKLGALSPAHAENNWWGDGSGPYHEILNSEGKGDVISDGVIFTPWLKVSIEEPSGFSSVAFIPGIQASRLYKQGLLWENQLWEPNRNGDARKLFMDKDGKSVDAGIYTRDIIKETNVPVSADGFGLNIYKKFSESMDKLVASSTISAWKDLPYDWRFDLSDIVGGGVKWAGGNISFISQKPEGQLPYMISELEKLADNSKNGKVTIITHSNGGLVAKVLLKKLAEMKGRGESDLIDKVDRLIMVATPQLGTPQAITSMLHGDGQELGFGFLLSAPVAREFAENMLGAYNLLPSEKYFNTVLNPMIKFDSSVDKLNNWRLSYGDEISDYAKFQDFILGKEGRTKPSSGNISIPNVLSASLLGVSENNHRTLDDWQIPASIEVIQIAGWGLDTVSGVEYSVEEECIPVTGVTYCALDYVLKRQPTFTSDGDETVVTPSAIVADGKTYYLDLYKYNKFLEFNIDREHKNIMEVLSIQTLIDEIIKEEATSTLPKYITLTKPESENKKLRLSIHSPVSIGIYDSLGNHTGIIQNPNPNSDLELVEENIPNSYYMNFGEGKYVGFDSGSQNKVELNGTGVGTFTLKIGEYSGDIEATSTAFIDIPVTSAMKGELNIENLDTLPQLKIDVEGDGVFDFEIKPSEEFDPILFLEIMKKTIKTFDLKKGVEKNLIKRIDNLIKMIKKGKIKQAEKKIKSFIKKFEPKKKQNKKISEEEKQAILNMLNQLLVKIK